MNLIEENVWECSAFIYTPPFVSNPDSNHGVILSLKGPVKQAVRSISGFCGPIN